MKDILCESGGDNSNDSKEFKMDYFDEVFNRLKEEVDYEIEEESESDNEYGYNNSIDNKISGFFNDFNEENKNIIDGNDKRNKFLKCFKNEYHLYFKSGHVALSHFDLNKIDFKSKIILMKGILNGLKNIHKNKIIHFDLKPENIIIDIDSLTPFIIDFGNSYLKDEYDEFEQHENLTSLYYASPESLLDMKCSYNSDIW